MTVARHLHSIRNGTFAFARASAFLILAAAAHAQINTIPNWNGTDFISTFGVVDTATYGQVITVPSGVGAMTAFAFEIGNCTGAVTLRGEVYAWNGTRATGAALFESATQTVPAGDNFTLVTFNTGNLSLSPGTYIIFASTSKDQGGASLAGCGWGAINNDATYPGGSFKFLNNNTNVAAWTSSNWSGLPQDLAFRVDGIAPPTPVPPTNVAAAPAASTTSLLIGLVALTAMGLYLSRHRQQT
jgi:hypothetical protein